MRKRIFIKLLLTLFLFFTLNIFAKDLKVEIQTGNSISNGSTIFVEIDTDIGDDNIGEVKFQDKSFPIYKYQKKGKGHYYALIPVNYYAKLGNSLLKVSYHDHHSIRFKLFQIEVKEGRYKSEKLTVARNKAKPNPKSQIRIQKEYKEAMKIYNTLTPKSYWEKPFILPMNSKITSPFGTKRVFNDTVKSYHSGTDFQAPIGSKIIASNDGVVALAKDRFYAGNSVVIDHGQGIYTVYYHLSKISVKAGDYIKRGDLLGLSGATGRITGPHLHFGARVNGVQVNPLQLIETLNLMNTDSYNHPRPN